MARTPEGVVKNDIKTLLLSFGVWFAGAPKPTVVNGWLHMPVPTPFGVHGIPDFCGILFGEPFYVEAKAPAGKGSAGAPSGNQLDRHAEIRTAGGHCVVAYSAEQVEMYIASTWPEKYARLKEEQKTRRK